MGEASPSPTITVAPTSDPTMTPAQAPTPPQSSPPTATKDYYSGRDFLEDMLAARAQAEDEIKRGEYSGSVEDRTDEILEDNEQYQAYAAKIAGRSSSAPEDGPHESRPENGAVLWCADGYEWPCEFVVENHNYLDYCFLFVDAITHDYIQTMYVQGNSTATFSMPAGLYELRYACGPSTSWCCFWHQFEDATAYGMSDDPFYFEVTDETYTVWTVAFETADPTMDDMDTSDIDESEFFGT